MSNLHRGHSIDDSYQVSVVAMVFNQSGRNEQTDDRQRTPSDDKSSYCPWQDLLKRILKCEYLLVM